MKTERLNKSRKTKSRQVPPVTVRCGIPQQSPSSYQYIKAAPYYMIDPANIVSLQRSIGNRAVMQLLEAKIERSLNAKSFTVNRDPIFGSGQYSPCKMEGKRLIVHKLVHSIKQQKNPGSLVLQRSPSGNRDLQSPRFKGDQLLEKILDGEEEMGIGKNDRGPAVRKIQRALIDAGYPLPKYGADGKYGPETKGKMVLFQFSSGHIFGIHRGKKLADGVVRSLTMLRLDQMYPQGARGAGTTPSEKKDFRIHGKWKSIFLAYPPYRYFFAYDSDVLDNDEKKKTIWISSPEKKSFPYIKKDEPVDLIGYASEEGTPSYNKDLALRRIKEVDKLWGSAGHFAKRNPVPKPQEGIGKIDYRYWRAVEVVSAGSGVSKSKGKGKSTTSPIVPCPIPPTKINKALEKAKEMITKAIDSIKNPTQLSPNTQEALKLFRGASAVLRLQSNLNAIYKHLDNNVLKRKKYQCASDSYIGCGGKNMAINTRCGPNAMMIICPDLMSETDSEKAAYWLIHEGAHGAQGVCASDFARYFQRMILVLEQDHALKNADSYSLFVTLIYRPGSMKVGPEVKDRLIEFISEKEKKQVKQAMAFSEVWIQEASGQTKFLYSEIIEARSKHKWKMSPYMYKMNLLAPRFGLTRPPRIPSKRDQWAVAAIHDRYSLMANAITREPIMSSLEIKRIRGGNDRWFPGPGKPGDKIELGSGFFSQSNTYNRVLFLLLKLVEATPDISETFESKYVEFADLNRQHAGFPSP